MDQEPRGALREYHALMVTGAPGSGKTMIAQQLMVKLWDVNKCHPFRVTKPSDYTKNHNPDIPQVFHIDDVFGSTNFVRCKYDAWAPVLHNMRDDIRSKNTFVIFTSRDNILNSNITDAKNNEVFRQCINVSDKKFALTESNKRDIFESHAKANQLDIEYYEIVVYHHAMQEPPGYPERVRFLCSMRNATKESRIRYFRRPMEYLSSIIGSYREKDHLSYCILMLLLMNDGKLPVSFLHPSNNSSKLVQTCLNICDLPSTTTMGALLATANHLCESFLIMGDECFLPQHETVMEAITLDIGQVHPSDILNRCSMEFLLERVFTDESAPPDNEYVVVLKPKAFPQLCARLMKEIQRCVHIEDEANPSKGNPDSMRSLSACSVFRDPSFVQVFLCHLRDMESFHLLLTSSSKHSTHPTFLFFACASGQDALIHEVMSSHLADVQQLSRFGDHLDCLLYAACYSGSPAAARALLETGARADYRTGHDPNDMRNGMRQYDMTSTTLMHGAYSGSVDVLRLILDRLQQQRVDVTEHSNVKDCEGRTVLQWWVWGARVTTDALQILLDAGADVDLRDNEGRTALYWSAVRSDEITIRLLLEAGADINAKDIKSRTALYRATKDGRANIVRLLVKAGADINVRDDADRTVLYRAAECGDDLIVRLLVETGADIHVVCSNETPLEAAVLGDYTDVADFLLSYMSSDALDQGFSPDRLRAFSHPAAGEVPTVVREAGKRDQEMCVR